MILTDLAPVASAANVVLVHLLLFHLPVYSLKISTPQEKLVGRYDSPRIPDLMFNQSSSSHEKNPRVPQMLFWNNLTKKIGHGLEARVSSGMHSLGLEWKGNGFWKNATFIGLTGALFEPFITAECFSTTEPSKCLGKWIKWVNGGNSSKSLTNASLSIALTDTFLKRMLR